MPRATVLLDACIAINLAATDRIGHVARTLDIAFVMAQQAADEVGHLRDTVDGEAVMTAINMDLHAANGIVQVIPLETAEYALYIELASVVDDGEAATIAVAAARGLQLATDDRKARALCAERHLPEPLRTLALINAYADSARLTEHDIRDLIVKIRDRASFQPQRSDPHHKWWHHHIADA
jgi:predicted nucleic acid-binding protein